MFMNAPGNLEKDNELLPLPQWLVKLIPELNLIPEISQLPQAVVDELETAFGLTEKDRKDIEAIDPREMATSGMRPIIWTSHVAQKTFAKHYCKNFRFRITMRDHPIYAEKRTTDKKLTATFRDSVRKCAPHLAEQTWGGFYQDIDQALVKTRSNITRAQIELSLIGKADEKQLIDEAMNVELVATVIYLRLQGYAYYPDLVR